MSKNFLISNDYMHVSYDLTPKPNPNRYKMHTHEEFEIYFFIDGKGTYYVEGNPYHLKKGDLLILNSAESHFIDISPDMPYQRSAIHFKKEIISFFDKENILLTPFTERPLGEFNLFRKSDFKTNTYLLLLQNIINSEDNRELQILTNIFALLNEIYIAFIHKEKSNTIQKETQIQQIIKYINNNLNQNLTLKLLCNTFFISETQLTKKFKILTGTTVGEYITTKRLTAANALINEGGLATKIYTDFGYADYSSFYRAYKKFFGHSPKKR